MAKVYKYYIGKYGKLKWYTDHLSNTSIGIQGLTLRADRGFKVTAVSNRIYDLASLELRVKLPVSLNTTTVIKLVSLKSDKSYIEILRAETSHEGGYQFRPKFWPFKPWSIGFGLKRRGSTPQYIRPNLGYQDPTKPLINVKVTLGANATLQINGRIVLDLEKEEILSNLRKEGVQIAINMSVPFSSGTLKIPDIITTYHPPHF